MDIDIQGASQIRQKMPEAVFVFLLPPTRAELEKRLTLRGSDAQGEIAERLQKSWDELQHVVHYDYFIINDELSRAAEQLRNIILSESSKVSRIDLAELQSLWEGRG
jgi:guanylate kinase